MTLRHTLDLTPSAILAIEAGSCRVMDRIEGSVAQYSRTAMVQKRSGEPQRKLRALEGSVIHAATSRPEATLKPAMTKKAAWNP